MKVDGIVLCFTPFQDDDAMINIVTKKSFYSFLANGVLKINSKNAPSVQPLTLSSFEIWHGEKGPFLRKGEIIQDYSKTKIGKNCLFVTDFILEITNKMLVTTDSSDIFDILKRCLELLNNGFDPYTIALIYFAKVIKIAGYSIDVNHCVQCNNSRDKIVSFNIHKGGFICENCFNKDEDQMFSDRYLKIIEFIFKVPLEKFDRISFEKEENINLLNILSAFIKEKMDIDLKSIKLFVL